MAIIPLRAYNREIEGMIDNGQLDEAVAHCRHILATFPKHVASYRLLGKAHLEQQRISDATDIFQRVLSSVPDDFIANVGMSIIREDENNLDASIWHMELAYEAQPANIAIQDELRRLYGRRDGMQPPKVRLTRGVLARMYAKGGLYDQAIAELHAAISEDPNRPDLQLLLAQMFYQTSQRVEAVDTCVNILKKIPSCLEANRILAVSLPEAEGSDAVKNYRQIVISMDPYYAFAEPEAISSDQVPENAVNIEKLEWKSGIQIAETPAQPNWATSLGISMEKPAEEKLPDWLKSAEAPPPASADENTPPSVSAFIWDTQEVEKIITDTSKPEGEIPDWMKDAGWQPASGDAIEAPEETKLEEPIADLPANEDLQKADIPDWLLGIAPEDVIEGSQPTQSTEDNRSTPWLEEFQPGPTDSIIQWLEEKKPEVPATSPTQEENIAAKSEEEMPDWLKDLDISQTPTAQSEKPAESTIPLVSEPSAMIQEPAIPEAPETKLTSFEETLEQAVETPPSQDESLLMPEISESEESAAALTEDIPDWLKDLAGEQPAKEALVSTAEEIVAETPLPSEQEPALEQPVISQGTPVTELPVSVEEIPATQPPVIEELPEAEMPAISEELPAAEVPPISEKDLTTELPVTAEELPSSEIPPFSEEQLQIVQQLPVEGESAPVTPESMSDSEAFAWLEGLATQQAAKEEELTTPAIENEITPPEWVKLEAEPTPAEAGELEPQLEETAPAVPAEEIPEWIKGLGEEPEVEPVSEEPLSAVPPETELPKAEELPAWMLEMEQPEPEKEEQVSSEEVLEWKSDELPAWLKEITETAPLEAAPTAMELTAAEEIPPASVEPGSEWTEEIVPPTEVGEEVTEEPHPEITTWVPEIVEPVQPLAAIPVELEVAPAPVIEDLVTKAIEIPVPIPPEELPVPTKIVSEANQVAITEARNAVDQGLPTQAAEFYTGLIKQNYHLDEIIKDLQDALYRFPVDVDMWVTLGDAYFRTDELQEALNAYTKAEELVR
ncbi:MAG: tetratricopeptide repeat protein [Anaerolineales bacterium]